MISVWKVPTDSFGNCLQSSNWHCNYSQNQVSSIRRKVIIPKNASELFNKNSLVSFFLRIVFKRFCNFDKCLEITYHLAIKTFYWTILSTFQRTGLVSVYQNTCHNHTQLGNQLYIPISCNLHAIKQIIIRSTHGRGADPPFFCVSDTVQYWYG